MDISSGHLRQIYAHAVQCYPYECFGFLVGVQKGRIQVVRVVPGSNAQAGRPDRFEMTAEEFVVVESVAERDGFEVLGFYHSHPDWPPIPSKDDLRLAWSHSWYMIVSISNWHPAGVAVWRLSDDQSRRFVQASLAVVDDLPIED
jgi:proteasome lid subunit RPN8/RPN11